MKESDAYDAIEQYLLGQMPDDERAALESRLRADPELAKQFARQKREHEALQVLVEDRLRTQLEGWKKTYPLREKSGLRRLGILAGLIGMLVLLWKILPFGQKDDTPVPANMAPPAVQPPPVRQPVAATPLPADTPTIPMQTAPDARQYLALATEFREPVRFPTTNLRHADTPLDILDSALLDLEAQRYTTARTRLHAVPPAHPRYADAQYCQGLAYYAQGAFGKSIPLLERAAEMPGYLYSDQAAWYLTLAYLQNNQTGPCRQRARQIAEDEGHTFQKNARKLLERLETMRR
jgi:tetratricopeptide (TPR) repeat protein